MALLLQNPYINESSAYPHLSIDNPPLWTNLQFLQENLELTPFYYLCKFC